MKSVDGYERLADVLERAFDQAATGKGAERHADNKPFHRQPMQQIADRRGVGFILGQSDKKSEEAQGMANRGQVDAAVRELLGAIVYLAGAVIWLERHRQPGQPVAGNDNEQPHDCCPVCQHNDGHHHPKCTLSESVTTTAVVQLARFNELPETALKMIVNHAEAELLRIQADKMTGKNLGR